MKQMIMLFRGFRFGMLLQIAIGPVCVYVLKTALESGAVNALAAAFAAALADAVFVTLAILGVGVFLDKPGVKKLLKYTGALILACYGAGILLGGFGIHIIPGLSGIAASADATSAFVYCFLLTASSPLTVLFWTGVFASRLTDENYGKAGMYTYGAGAVLSTMLSLSAVALLAGLLQPIMTQGVINILNIAVGLALAGYAVRMAVR